MTGSISLLFIIVVSDDIAVCRELQGKLEYSDGLNIGSVASYQCAHASGHQQIRCETTGWSGALCGIILMSDGHIIMIIIMMMIYVA